MSESSFRHGVYAPIVGVRQRPITTGPNRPCGVNLSFACPKRSNGQPLEMTEVALPKQTELAGLKYSLSGHGEVYTFSTMYNVPKGFEDQAPYTVAIIRLDEGPMVTAQLTDVNQDQVKIGMRVEMVTRKIKEEEPEGQIIYGYKFRPILAQGSA